MTDVTVKRLDDFESHAGKFLYAGKGLGVSASSRNGSSSPANGA